MKDLVIAGYDIETTGLLTPDHRIVEIYIGLWRNGQKIWQLDQRIDPQRSIAADAQRVHGIAASDLIGKPTFEKIAPVISRVFSKAHIGVAHNGEEFDWEFIKKEMRRVKQPLPPIPVFDTMKEGVWATPHGKSPNLKELCFACGVEYDAAAAHAASYDVDVMMDCFHRGTEWGFFDPLSKLDSESDKVAA